MRQFTSWAEAVGGFLTHHGVPGFLANVETVRDIDDEESTWTAFFARWRKIHGDKWLTSNELRLSADAPARSIRSVGWLFRHRRPRPVPDHQVARQAAHRADQPVPRQRSYETKEGEKRTVYEVEVDDIGPSLRNASAKVNKVARSGSGDGGYGGSQRGSSSSGGRPSGADADPWATEGPGGYTDEPPF